MTRPPYDAEFKARAMAWVARKTTPARVIAEELGVRPGIVKGRELRRRQKEPAG